MVSAWYMTSDECECGEMTSVSLKELAALGVEYYEVDSAMVAKGSNQDETLRELCDKRGYDYSDVIEVSPEAFPDNLEDKLKIFFEEHLHTDEEVRLVLDGSGFFDVRSGDDRWIRILVQKNDLIVLPAGIYHRFTIDDNKYIRAMRLFQGVPVWTPYNRNVADTDELPARARYAENFLKV